MNIGDLVRFSYRGKIVHDPRPTVLILHPNWQNQTHGLNFNYLSEQEINYIRSVLNPVFAAEMIKKDPRIASQMQRISHIINTLVITQPHDFYLRFVRGFIQPRGWDPYRRYTPSGISGVQTVVRQAVMVGTEKDSMFNKFIQKFQHMRGPQMQLTPQRGEPADTGYRGGPTTSLGAGPQTIIGKNGPKKF